MPLLSGSLLVRLFPQGKALAPLMDSSSVFLQADLFHPIICGELSQTVPMAVWTGVIAAVKENIAAMVGDDGGFGTKVSMQCF